MGYLRQVELRLCFQDGLCFLRPDFVDFSIQFVDYQFGFVDLSIRFVDLYVAVRDV